MIKFFRKFISLDTRSTTFKYVGNRVKSILKHRQPYLCAQKGKKNSLIFGERAKTIALQIISNFEEMFCTKYKVYHF